MKRDTVDIERLKQLYYEDELSIKEVSQILNVSYSLILRLMIKNNLERREAKQNYNMNDKIKLRTLKKMYYEEKMGIRKIANILGVSDSSILKFMIEHKLERRPQKAIICDLQKSE